MRAQKLAQVLVLGVLASACTRDNPKYSGELDLGVNPTPDLAGADLAGADLAGVDLASTPGDLSSVDLASADLTPPPYQLSVADATVVEGDNGVATLRFKLTVAPASPDAITLRYATSDGTAKMDDADYLSVAGRITIPAGATDVELVVPVLGDLYDEANETLALTISAAVGATISRATATGTVTDDDAQPVLNVDDAAAYESLISAGSSGANFRVWMSAVSGRTVTVSYATAAGTAGAADFTAKSGMLTFAPGETEKQVTVPVLNDFTGESIETFTLSLSGATRASINTATATGTIYDDDAIIPVLSAQAQMVTEGDAGDVKMTFTITTGLPVGSTVSFHLATRPISAKDGIDYAGIDQDVMITAGNNSATVDVMVHGDATCEEDETFVLVLSAPMGATIATPMVLGRIKNDDESPTLSIAPATDNEGDLGSSLLFVPLSLSLQSGKDALFRISTMNQTAATPDDYALTTGMVRIPAGFDTWELAVPLHGDTTVEPNETFGVQASMPTAVKIAGAQATCTIDNDD